MSSTMQPAAQLEDSLIRWQKGEKSEVEKMSMEKETQHQCDYDSFESKLG